MRRPDASRSTGPVVPTGGFQQHDLLPTTAARLVASSTIKPGETVVEVGPGLGALTHEVLLAGARVIAVERDLVRLQGLKARFKAEIADGRLRLFAGDARDWRPEISGPWRVLANPPFNLTAELVRGWLLDPGISGHPAAIDLLLQREAAMKFCAIAPARITEPGETRSSVLVKLAGTFQSPSKVAREEVQPPSRVDLAWWRFRTRKDAPTPLELALVDALLEEAFAGPHTVAEALRGLATAEQIRRQAREHGYKPTDHPRMVAPPAWLDFARHLAMCGKLTASLPGDERPR